MLDNESLPDYTTMFVIAAVMTVITVGVLLAESIRPGYIVLSAPIALGAFLLGVRAYMQAGRESIDPDQ